MNAPHIPDDGWHFVVEDDGGEVLAEGDRSQFHDAIMALEAPNIGESSHFHIGWYRSSTRLVHRCVLCGEPFPVGMTSVMSTQKPYGWRHWPKCPTTELGGRDA